MIKARCLLVLSAFLCQAAFGQDLSATYDLAVQHDPKLREVEANRDAVLETKPQSVAQLLPNLSISGQMDKNYYNTSASFLSAQQGFQSFWTSSAALRLRQPIYHHEYWVQLSQSDSQIAKAEALYAAEQQNLMLRTSQAYFNVLFAQDSLQFAKAERQAIERQLEQAKARFEVGLTAITDVNEAQAGFDLSRANEIQAENELDNTWEALKEIIGPTGNALSGLVSEIPLLPPQPVGIDEWDQRAQQSNLKIVAAQNQVELAKKSVDLQFAGHMPSLDLVAQAGFADSNRPNGVRYDNQVVGMQLSVPLYSGGSVNSKVRQAQHEYDASNEALDRERRSTTRTVKDAYRRIIASISQVGALKAAVISSQSALEATEAGMEVGTRTMVDVLTEQRNLYRAQRDYAKARYDYIVSSLTLKQAAGFLMKEDIDLVNGWLKP